MSFRGRLILFFVMIVALPMAALAAILVGLTSDSREGKADAQLSTGLATALTLYERDVAEGKAAGSQLARDSAVTEAVNEGSDAVAAEARSAARGLGIEYLRITSPDGDAEDVISLADPIAVASVSVAGESGEYEFEVATTGPTEYVNQVAQLTGLEAAIASPDGVAAATVRHGSEALPGNGESETLDGEEVALRAAAGALPDSTGSRVVLFTDVEEGGFLESSPGIAAALAAFLVVAVAFVITLVRTLQGQIAAMLAAARRIGSGDFSRKVPVVGNDEMAGLASEFNSMSDQLEAQMDQLRTQRNQLNRSVERLGEAFAAGLDRDSLVRIILETAIESCAGEYGRIALADGTVIEEPSEYRGPARDAAMAGEKRGAREGGRIESRREDGHALTASLRRLGPGSGSVGMMSVARRGAAFGQEERSVFLYLVAQASASLENIQAHERVSEQAITDELTGLANNRAFRETIDREAQRAERFDHNLSLILLDVDDFKLVNDTHGHPQGDEVLRVIGRILAEESRGIDEPARYGGEEFVVALPETDLAGAAEVAERIRARIAAEPITMLDGSEPMFVSASFGAASLPASAADVRELIDAADKALYEAKRAGKNRVAVAGGSSATAHRQ